jgi:gamma-glutamylcyclotransferase (GGCT)/AIG2-like uncharacterized protein YtfP
MRFFFYGTLRDPEVRRAVIGPGVERIAIEPGSLAGYRCVFVRGRPYPVLRPERGGCVEGVIATGVDSVQAARIDRFETEEYRAGKAQAADASGKAVEAIVYFAARPGLATATPWRLDEWQRRHKRGSLRGWFKL